MYSQIIQDEIEEENNDNDSLSDKEDIQFRNFESQLNLIEKELKKDAEEEK